MSTLKEYLQTQIKDPTKKESFDLVWDAYIKQHEPRIRTWYADNPGTFLPITLDKDDNLVWLNRKARREVQKRIRSEKRQIQK